VDAYHELDLVRAEAEAAKEKGKYQETADAARAEQDQLATQLAFVIFDPGASATIGGRAITPDQWGKPVPVEPGSVEVVLSSAAGGEKKSQVLLKPGEKTTLVPPGPAAVAGPAPAAPPPPPPAPADPGASTVRQSTLGWVAGGVGLAGMATFAIFGLVNNSTFSDLESDCDGNRCPEHLIDTAESGRSYQTLANVGLGVGIVGLGTAVVLLLTAKSPGASAGVDAASTSPQVVVGPRSVSVAGAF
jgi:hypothetical protein